MDRAHRQSLARSATLVRELEQRLHPLSRLGEGGGLAAAVRRRLGRARPGIRPGRRHHRQGPSSRTGCKRGTQSQAIGRSKGGLTTKILALTDALGNLVCFVLLPGQRFDTVGVPPLIDGVAFGALIADTAFDSNDIIADLNERGAKAVIAQHPRRTTPLDIDAEMYKWRHLIENFFCKLKEFKRIALRAARYTTLLRAVELWGAVRADGPGRLAGDEELPPVNGLVVCREEDLSQQIKANPEDRLSTAFVGLEDDRPVFRLPFTGRVGERKGYGQHSEKLADPVGVNEVGVLEIEAPRLGGREERFDLPPPPVMGQGDLGIGVGRDYKQVSADQPRRSQFQCRSKRAVA